MEKFSWKRVRMLWRYMYPAVKSQILWYPVLSVVSALFGALMLSVSSKLLLVAELPTMLMGFMIFLAPVALVRHDYKHTTALLPVTASEKLTVLVLYFVVGVALLVNVPYYLTCGIVWLFSPDIYSMLISMFSEYFNGYSYVWLTVSSYPINCSLIGIVLLSVIGSQRPTVSRTVLYLVLSYFIYMFVVGIMSALLSVLGVITSFSNGTFQTMARGNEVDHEVYIREMILDSVLPMISAFCLVIGLIAMVVVYRKVYKKLKTGGF